MNTYQHLPRQTLQASSQANLSALFLHHPTRLNKKLHIRPETGKTQLAEQSNLGVFQNRQKPQGRKHCVQPNLQQHFQNNQVAHGWMKRPKPRFNVHLLPDHQKHSSPLSPAGNVLSGMIFGSSAQAIRFGFLASEGPDGRTFSSLRSFSIERRPHYDLHVSILQAFCRALVVFIKLERVPWFGVRKIGMVWGPREGPSQCRNLASFDQLQSCAALLLSLSLILQQLRLSCWLRKQERNCERL